MSTAEDAVNAEGLAVILCNSDDRPEKETAYLDVLAEQRVQGVIITPTAELTPALEALRQRGVPSARYRGCAASS
jgi:LacI family transcriptional regulator